MPNRLKHLTLNPYRIQKNALVSAPNMIKKTTHQALGVTYKLGTTLEETLKLPYFQGRLNFGVEVFFGVECTPRFVLWDKRFTNLFNTAMSRTNIWC